MIGKRRRERRRQGRAAIERYEYQHANDQGRVEAAEQRAVQAEARNDELRRLCSGMEKRLDDANAELARWGLEPVTRDLPESDEHPQRYRRHSDWRSTRTGEQLAELLERHAECAPAGVDVSVAWHDDPTQFLRACGEGVLTHAYEPPLPTRPDVPPPIPPEGWGREQVAASYGVPVDLIDPPPPTVAGLQESLRVVRAEHQRREDRSTERVAHLRAALGEAHGKLRERKRQVRGQGRRITRLVAELDDVRGEYAGYRIGAMQAEADYERRLAALPQSPALDAGDRVQISVGSHVHIGVVASVKRTDEGTVEVRFET